MTKIHKRTKRLRLPKRIFDNVPAFFEDVEFRAVESVAEFKQASHLVYQEYLSSGYIQANPSELHLSIHQLPPTSVTFIAIHKQSNVLGTLTLIEDSSLGVPMDTIYNAELGRLRQEGTGFAEIGRLAMNEKSFHEEPFTLTRYQRLLFLFYLYKAMYDYFRSSPHLEKLVACFHPQHDFMYDFLGFEPLGELKSYSSVQGSPAIARSLTKKEHQLKAITNPLYQDLMFYWEEPPRTFHRLQFLEADIRQLFIEESNVLKEATTEQINTIQKLYPSTDFKNLTKETRKLGSTGSLLEILSKTKLSEPGLPLSSEFEKSVDRLLQHLREYHVEKENRVAILTGECVETTVAVQAMDRLGIDSKRMNPQDSIEAINAELEEFRPQGLFLRKIGQLRDTPNDLLDELEWIVVLEPMKDMDHEEMLLATLFSPPVSKENRLLLWNE